MRQGLVSIIARQYVATSEGDRLLLNGLTLTLSSTEPEDSRSATLLLLQETTPKTTPKASLRGSAHQRQWPLSRMRFAAFPLTAGTAAPLLQRFRGLLLYSEQEALRKLTRKLRD